VLIALNKPFGVISKFSAEPGKRTLADYVPIRAVYPAGRLDTDSEGCSASRCSAGSSPDNGPRKR
jgi:23S rRNA pseudouridine2457 synthase